MREAVEASHAKPGRPPWLRAAAGFVLALGVLAPGLLGATGAAKASVRIAQAASPAPTTNPPAQAPVAAPSTPAASDVAKLPNIAGTPATVMDASDVESLLGKDVQSAAGEAMGRIADILVDKTGHMRAAVIDFGGFLGVGSRKIAVEWQMIHFPAGKAEKIIVDLPRDELRVAPAYKEGEPVVILGKAGGSDAKAPPGPGIPEPAGALAPAAK